MGGWWLGRQAGLGFGHKAESYTHLGDHAAPIQAKRSPWILACYLECTFTPRSEQYFLSIMFQFAHSHLETHWFQAAVQYLQGLSIIWWGKRYTTQLCGWPCVWAPWLYVVGGRPSRGLVRHNDGTAILLPDAWWARSVNGNILMRSDNLKVSQHQDVLHCVESLFSTPLDRWSPLQATYVASGFQMFIALMWKCCKQHQWHLGPSCLPHLSLPLALALMIFPGMYNNQAPPRSQRCIIAHCMCFPNSVALGSPILSCLCTCMSMLLVLGRSRKLLCPPTQERAGDVSSCVCIGYFCFWHIGMGLHVGPYSPSQMLGYGGKGSTPAPPSPCPGMRFRPSHNNCDWHTYLPPACVAISGWCGAGTGLVLAWASGKAFLRPTAGGEDAWRCLHHRDVSSRLLPPMVSLIRAGHHSVTRFTHRKLRHQFLLHMWAKRHNIFNIMVTPKAYSRWCQLGHQRHPFSTSAVISKRKKKKPVGNFLLSKAVKMALPHYRHDLRQALTFCLI